MEINKMKSNLKMKNLFFSKCSIERESVVESGDYNADLQRKITKEGEHQYSIELVFRIIKKDLSLEVVANAQFLYEADDYSEEESVIRSNTVAIMFPFIRSQVSILTTQPGMQPIVLPPINTTKLS